MGDCKGCAQTQDTVPAFAYREALARQDRTIRRLWIVIIVLIAAICVIVGIAAYERLQYDYSAVDVNAEDGTANYIGNDGDINNGVHTSTDAAP